MLGRVRLLNKKVREKLLLFARSTETNELLENFAIAAVSTILLVRLFLRLTHYPQIGGAGLHIAHMLWGGLFLVLALFISLVFVNKEARKLSTITGGIGFGLFVDEIGKFVTRDNNYFYEPTFVLIYLTFVMVFFIFRFLVRTSELTEKEYAMNALEVMKEVIYYDLDDDELEVAKNYLNKSDTKNPLVKVLKTNLARFEVDKSNESISFAGRFKRKFRLLYETWFKSDAAINIISFTYVAVAVVRFILALKGLNYEWNFWEWGRNMSSILVFLFVLQGLNHQRKGDKLNAFRSYRKAALVSIFVVQVFDFYRRQLLALVFLTISLISYVTLNYVINLENNSRRRRENK